MELTLKHCKYYHIPIMSIDDYIKFFRDKYKAWLPIAAVRKRLRDGQMDYVKHKNKRYVVIDHKSMEEVVIRLPKGTKYLYNVEKGKPARWMTPQQAFSKGL